MPDISCVGLIVCDILIKPVDKSIFSADVTRLDTLRITPGGDALNASINMSRLGINVALAGKVGNDAFGEYLVREAERCGIDASSVSRSDEYSTSTSIVMLDKSGERHFAYYGGSNDDLRADDVDEGMIRNSKIVHLGGAMLLESLDGPAVAGLFEKAKSFGALTSMDVTWDPSGRWLGKIEGTLYHTDIFMPSLDEAKMVSGCETPHEMRSFFKKYGLKTLAVKLGADGCYVTDFKDEYIIAAFNNVKAVDTTGAGDAFVAGFLTGCLKGWDIRRCGLFGNAAASLCVSELGATTGAKTMAEVLAFIKASHISF